MHAFTGSGCGLVGGVVMRCVFVSRGLWIENLFSAL